jgi:hypothetical protein
MRFAKTEPLATQGPWVEKGKNQMKSLCSALMVFFTLAVAVPAHGQTTSTNTYQQVRARIQNEIAAWRATHTNSSNPVVVNPTTTTTNNTPGTAFAHPGTGKYGWLVNPAPGQHTNAFTYFPGKVRRASDPIPNR